MTARGYEFYLRVLNVSLMSELHSKVKFVSPRGHVMSSISPKILEAGGALNNTQQYSLSLAGEP